MSTDHVFTKYAKISDSSHKWALSDKESHAIKTTKWIVTEKIHGANFSFMYDVLTNVMLYGKRSGILTPDDNFFGYKQILPETLPKIMRIIKYIMERHKSCNVVCVFGELFGGFWPITANQASVPTVPTVMQVQSGVYYSPDLHFYAFDIMVDSHYVDYSTAMKAFAHSGVLYAEPLYTGSFVEACNYKVGFNSTIPARLKLKLDISGNKAEGVVVRPLSEITFDNGKQRAILKIKIPEFSEMKYTCNDFDRSKAKSAANTSSVFDYGSYFINNVIDRYINVNRVGSAVSKVGNLTKSNQAELVEVVVDDIMSEFLNHDLWPELSSEQQGKIKAELVMRTQEFITSL